MSFIDTTYFVRDINIPISSTSGLNGGINDSINLYEDEVLKLLLGYKLWSLMKAAIAAYDLAKADYDSALLIYNPETDPPLVIPVLDARFDRLINGAEFSFELYGTTIETKWNGFKNTSKRSLIANYVYFMHRQNNDSQYTGIGETKAKGENSIPVSPRQKMVTAWNGFVEMYGEANSYMLSYDNSTYQHENENPSAYNFMLANLTDYPEWRFTPQQQINIWGL